MMMTNDVLQQYPTTRENSLVNRGGQGLTEVSDSCPRVTVKSTSDIAIVPVPLLTLSVDQREAAFIKLLAEAIASEIRRGGATAREPLEEPDEEISAAVSSAVADVRKVEEAGDEP